MFGLFGALAVVVAAIGLYSVISYSIAQRTHEFGVRLAIGADALRIVRDVLAYGLRIALVGAIAGAIIASIAGRRIESLLFNESARDPLVYAGVILGLLLVAAIACVAPALRAARVDPMEALRLH